MDWKCPSSGENGKMLKGWVTITGELAKLYPKQNGNTYYYDNRTGLGFYWGADDGGTFSCKEGTAYLYVPGSSSVKGYVLDDATDEDAIHLPTEFVDEMGDIYNIAGQRVNKPSQGIYIRGGRKYVGK